MANPKKTVYRDSPFGIAVHPHLNTPDAKFNPTNPMFKTGLDLDGAPAQKFKEEIDVAAQAAFDEFMQDGDGATLTPGERKKFTVYVPYEVLEDSDGNPTGVIRFDFKQNAIMKLRDGTVVNKVIGIYDATGEHEVHKIVFGGSEIRINYSLRPIPMKALKQVGVRLDFSRVQVRKMAERKAQGFGAVEGGYEDDGAPAGQGEQHQVGGGDY